MSAAVPTFLKLCPSCQSERPAEELTCEHTVGDRTCHWDLTAEPAYPAGQWPRDQVQDATPPPPLAPSSLACLNGHPMGAGDELCLICGADIATKAPPAASPPPTGTALPPEHPIEETVVDGWHLLRRIPSIVEDARFDSFVARAETGGPDVALVLYQQGAEPDPAVYDVLRRVPIDHIPTQIATGRYEGRAYEVTELISGQSLQAAGFVAANKADLLRSLARELGSSLESFSQWGLRHRDLHPGNVQIRSLEPLDLVVTGFGSARLSDFDLEAVAPLELTRYSAPEAIVGAVSAASDWWSLGMIVLEQATAGRCFQDVNDQAFRLHVVTRGISLPDDLSPEIRLLLRGLLSRDPLTRWSSVELRAWLAGEIVDAPNDTSTETDETGAQPIAFADKRFTRPASFALTAAEPAHWDAGRDLVLRGAVATWLDEAKADPRITSEVRRLAADASIEEDYRHALALMAMNVALPLTMRGEIITPNWILNHPVESYRLITSEVIGHLERMGREAWLTRMGYRAAAVRERAGLLEIVLDEEQLKVAVLASSRASLEAERDTLRRVYPDTDHSGLASILDRSQLSDEDLIILISASKDQYLPLATIVAQASDLAGQADIALDATAASAVLSFSRREIFVLVDERTANFARCGHERVDDWADSFRVERRMPLPRAAVLLAVPSDKWQQPPKQLYVKALLEHFEKRVSGSVSRGPLVKFVIGKTTPRVDLMELGTSIAPSEALLNHVLARDEAPVQIDPTTYGTNEHLDSRLRRLVSHANTFRRDTGLDGRTLGFPFLLMADGRGSGRSVTSMKLAPVLLWPIAIELQSCAGRRAATLAFDREREEVRLNPALEGILGTDQLAKWQAARLELLGRSSVKIGDVIDIFGALAAPQGRKLIRLPTAAPAASGSSFALIPAATLFNAEFTGQSVSADLRDLGRKVVAETALDAMIRVSETSVVPPELSRTSEVNKYVVVESDPSQEIALRRSQIAPGLLVEGPPGTGKSQTIVNVVGDAIGRGETVLVVCQKQAALKVVKKRLDAEGLTDRNFMIVDTTKDREMVIRALRDQLTAVRAQPPQRATSLRTQRREIATRIEALEQEVDLHHQALHQNDAATGLSYRQLLGRLVQYRADGQVLDIAALRTLLAPLDLAGVSAVEEACAPLANLWLDSAYEGSALSVLRPFATDETMAKAFSVSLASYAAAEESRRTILATHKDAFDTDNPHPCIEWLENQRPLFSEMDDAVRRTLANWLSFFKESATGRSTGRNTIIELGECIDTLEAMPAKAHDNALFSAINALIPIDLRQKLIDASVAVQKPSFISRFNPARWLKIRRSRAFLTSLGEATDCARLTQLRDALALEVAMRPVRQRIDECGKLLGVEANASSLAIDALKHEVWALVSRLDATAAAAKAVFDCPRPADAERMAITATSQAFAELDARFTGALARHLARQTSLASLKILTEWFPNEWLSAQASTIATKPPDRAALSAILQASPTVEAFQRFRSRAASLAPKALEAFAILRKSAATLSDITEGELDDVVRRSLGYAACLAWKGRIEEENPALLFERVELERKVVQLAELDREMRALNKALLREGVEAGRLAALKAWDEITRLTGPRARRLREIIDQGAELGLMHMRPVWLMNPDVASRILPLKAGLFDLVVYDEASQMLVEHALPTLFRARRVLISGDEKQMPPSSFFASRIDGDDDASVDVDFTDEAATETERTAMSEAWNRREVKDCPDLLHLGRSVLPTSTLQIHYRSKYRELIAFSNSAYYQGGLSVPARHPDAEVARVRPIEVVRVNGVYESQSNELEADAVVDILARYWEAPAKETPSIGVVTFNRKQADLIDDAIALRASTDTAFSKALDREAERVQNGEDMSFFVKNVENVQGDERDMIIFSTTFGRDKHGTFRRNFGVLSQTGGERRLNVAVTRAREKIVLVTSMPVADISDWLSSGRQASKPRDYLQAYLYYAEQMSSGAIEGARAATSKLSPAPTGKQASEAAADGFSRSVQDYVRSLGFAPITASDGDAFGLDFAIENPRTKLFGIGIECDAPRHPLLDRARAREIWRPSVLKRAIGTVHRVSSHAWFHRPNEERGRLSIAIQAAMNQGVHNERA